MAQIASEALIARLAGWGVDTVFGLPGDGINGTVEGSRRNRDRGEWEVGRWPAPAASMESPQAAGPGFHRLAAGAGAVLTRR